MIPGLRSLLIVLVGIVFWGLQILIILHALASWVPEWRWRRPPWLRPIDAIVAPMLRPIQRLLYRYSPGIDLSPLLLLIALQFVYRIVVRLLIPAA
jgi:uncharacterized protein YggT (Ycf19 family)